MIISSQQGGIMSFQTILDQFESRTKKSKILWEEAKEALPGGVAGSAGYLAPRPIYLEKAVAGKLFDVDGNEYIDLLLGGFLNILGHSPKPVVAAVIEQLNKGTSYMLFQETGLALVRKMKAHLPHMERIRFANSGTESTMFAIRTARSWTKREKIAKPEGGYHGQHDYVMMSGISGRNAGSDTKPTAVADCAGIPKFIQENTIVFPWNDIESTVSIIKANADELAAVILEPVQGFGLGAVEAEKGYLEAIREVTSRYGIVLIFDEVMNGFRIGGMGGAASYYGVSPDLACYGKVIGGGLPIGAFGGREDIMEKTLSPAASAENKVFQSGTFTGNALAMAAGLACLTELERRDYSYIDNLAEKIRTGLRQQAEKMGYNMQVTGVGSIFYPHFNDRPIRSLRDKLRDNGEKNRDFSMGMIANGIYLPPHHTGATCFAHTEEDIDRVLAVSEQVFSEMKE